MKYYRVHITCPAGHTTYQDFVRRIDASKASFRENNQRGWYCNSIERLPQEGVMRDGTIKY